MHPHIPNYMWSRKVPQRTGNAHPNITPYDAYQTRTCPIYIAVGNNKQFAVLCQHLDLVELIQDPRFVDNATRGTNREAFKQILEQNLLKFDGKVLAHDLIQAGVPCGPILNVAEIVTHPHTVHRNMMIAIGEDYRGIASPIKLGQTPASYRQAPPAFAEHTIQVLKQKGFSDQHIEILLEQGIISQNAKSSAP